MGPPNNMTSCQPRRRRGPPRTLGAVAAAVLSSSRPCRGFAPTHQCTHQIRTGHHHRASSTTSLSMVRAPPGSGYLRHDASDESEMALSHPELTKDDALQISPPAFPDTYEPMLEYPGTMRPGRTPENMPYHDLPGLDVTDPDPVPWPHFQEIEWHHRWDPPHAQAPAMEEFIEMQGRWASVAEEAEMRAGMRRGVRERREEEEAGSNKGAPVVIMDDEEEEEGGSGGGEIGVGLGEGVEALLRTAREQAGAAGEEEGAEEGGAGAIKMEAEDDDEEEDEDEDDMDLFSELGLDADDEDEGEETEEADEEEGDFDDDYADDEEDISIEAYTQGDDEGDDDELDDGGFDYGE
ncbi:hypothetical protein ACHAXT_010974 [Thalassiosira profunda]